MVVIRQPLRSKNQTGREMYKIVSRTADDLKSIFFGSNGQKITADKLPLVEYFNYVKNIPYRRDPKPREIISRPRYIAKYSSLGADCKKKSLMIAAWLKANKIPFRFIASSRRPDKKVHHVFPQGKIGGQWVSLDATYKKNKIAMPRNDTKQEVLRP